MGKKYDIVTALDLCVDFLADCGTTIPEFGQKEKLVRDYNIELGGSCSIFAAQTARLGLITIGLGKTGDDFFGRLILNKLNNAHIDTSLIEIDKANKTGVGIALCHDNGDRAILTYIGTIDTLVPEDIPAETIGDTRHIHIGSYFLMKKLQPGYPEILIKAKKAGATISLDTNWDPDEKWGNGINEILPFVDILLLNEREIMALTKTDSILKAANALSDKIPVIAVKKGKSGALAFAGGRSYDADSLDIAAADTVGAGDSFDGGFVYGYLTGCEIDVCLRIGCICGSYSTSKPGGIAGQIDLKALESLLEGKKNAIGFIERNA